MEMNYNPGDPLPTGGGEQGPLYTSETPPPNYEPDNPEGFDPGPAIMQAGTDAYNAVIDGGGSHSDGMQAMGGACAQAAGELGIPPAEFNEAYEAFEDGYNTAQSEGGDAGTCINAGYDSANEATSEGTDYHPPSEMTISDPADYPEPGEGHVGHQNPVDMPEEMTHDWVEGAPADEHPCNCHVEGEEYGPGPELAPVLNADGEPMGAESDGAESGDMFGSAPEAPTGDEGGSDGPAMTGPPAYEGGPPTAAAPEGADIMDSAMDSHAMDGAASPEVDTGMADVTGDGSSVADSGTEGGNEDGLA
jgi:hypothetical protein